MSGNGIIFGSYFFDSNVNSCYLHILNNFILPKLQDFFNTQFEYGSFSMYIVDVG